MKKILLFTACLSLAAAGPASAGEPQLQNCIVVYGDSRTNHAVHQKIVDAIMQVNPAVVFHTGDMVEKGSSQEDWEMFDKITGPLRNKAEFYPAAGSHEKNIKLPFLDPKMFEDKTWYSLERCGLHCIVLDTNLDLSAGSAQYLWLENELKRMRADKKPILVFMHQSLFSVAKYSEAGAGLQKALAPLFEKYRVSIVFSGHDHNYQRFLYRHVYYIVTGGGGAPLHYRSARNRFNQKFIEAHHFCALSIGKDRLEVSAYDVDSKLLDRVEVRFPR
jgi:acid phosphatase type 7